MIPLLIIIIFEQELGFNASSVGNTVTASSSKFNSYYSQDIFLVNPMH